MVLYKNYLLLFDKIKEKQVGLKFQNFQWPSSSGGLFVYNWMWGKTVHTMDLFPRVHRERRMGPTWTHLLWVLVGGHGKLGLQTSDGGQEEGSGLGHLGGLLGLVAQLKDTKMEANVRRGVLTLPHIMWAQTEWIQLKEKDGSNRQEWHSDPGPCSVGTERMNTAKRQKDGSNHQAWCSDPGPRSVGTERMNIADLGNLLFLHVMRPKQ